jgi:hypothetical protein
MLPVHPLDPLDRLAARLRRADLDADVDRQAVDLIHNADVDLAFTNPWHFALHHCRRGRPVFAEGLDKQRDQQPAQFPGAKYVHLRLLRFPL